MMDHVYSIVITFLYSNNNSNTQKTLFIDLLFYLLSDHSLISNFMFEIYMFRKILKVPHKIIIDTIYDI